jgi:hypothetical protein
MFVSKTTLFETLEKPVLITELFLSYMDPVYYVSRGKTGKADTGKSYYQYL